MSHQYTATLYLKDTEIASKTGDDAESLYEWMLINEQSAMGDVHGKIVDNLSHEVVREFKKRSME